LVDSYVPDLNSSVNYHRFGFVCPCLSFHPLLIRLLNLWNLVHNRLPEFQEQAPLIIIFRISISISWRQARLSDFPNQPFILSCLCPRQLPSFPAFLQGSRSILPRNFPLRLHSLCSGRIFQTSPGHPTWHSKTNGRRI
jgi:hypothetical protein